MACDGHKFMHTPHLVQDEISVITGFWFSPFSIIPTGQTPAQISVEHGGHFE